MSALLRKIFAASIGKSSVPIKVIFCDGSSYSNSDAPAELTIVYKSRRTQLNSIINHGWGLIESYINQDVDIDGDPKLLIAAAAESGPTLTENIRQTRIPHPVIRLRNLWHEIRFGNRKISRAVDNALHHYNRGNEIFWQYLDPSMTYTCA